VAEAAADEILTLPLYPHITPVQQERVVAELTVALR
jgi:dTDP-4-amino-4,6-dideoxygalactose transaminase